MFAEVEVECLVVRMFSGEGGWGCDLGIDMST